MTTITIYPLFSQTVNISNLVLYAKNSGLTITFSSSLETNKTNGTTYSILTVSQILSAAQQSAITTIFQGTAYITFT